jgi:CBS domain containing-hemolysin-like protein/mannitol/fructose-specific phosphotransferase system IIA component
METALLLLLAVFLLLLNAFFVLAEFAAVKTRGTQVDALEARGEPRAGTLRHVVTHLDEYLSVCQVGITLASIGLGFVGELTIARMLSALFGSTVAAHSVAITISYVLVSFLHVVLGELVPKSVAIRTGEETALRIARPLRFFHRVFFVPLVVLNGTANAILRLMRLPPLREDRLPAEDEIRRILARSQKQGRISFRRLLLLENVFDFGAVRVRDAMIPLGQVTALRVDRPWEENRAILESTRRSRYPVLEGDPPRPLGILHVKDLIYRHELSGPVDFRSLIRPAPVTFPDELIENVLADLQQRRRSQMVLVQDPKKGFCGVITMEDIIEEIVGVIEDEFETEPALRLSDAVNEQRIVLDVAAPTLPGALAEIFDRVPPGQIPAPRDQVLHAILERERAMPTYLGHGLGVPHARLERLKAPCLFIARSKEGIQFGEDEHARAHVLFVLLTSSQAPRDQLRLLAAIARLRESEYVWDRLLAATTPAEVLEAIRGEALVLG